MNRIVIKYKDELHYDFDKTGKAILYRNPRENELDEKDTLISSSDKYSTHPKAGEPGLYDQTPVAQGFTAFADGCFLIEADGENAGSIRMLLEKGKRPKTRGMFNYYFGKVSIRLQGNNDRELYPLEGDTLEIQLLKNHVNDEIEKLSLSQKYYDEFYDEDDRIIKAGVRDYVLAYIKWVEDKLKEAITKKGKEATNILPNNETVAAHALFCYYLQERPGCYMDEFENYAGGKMKGLKAYVKDKGISEKSFQLTYNKMRKSHLRLTQSNNRNIDIAIQMMGKEYPEAVKLAQKELEIIELQNK